MRFKPPKILIEGGGELYLGYARQRIDALERWRLRHNQIAAHRTLVLPDAEIFLRCNSRRRQILIRSGGVPEILLASAASAAAYRYTDDRMLAPFSFSGDLHPFVNGEVHGNGYARYRGTWKTGKIDEGVFLGVVSAYEMEFTLSDLVITARTPNGSRAVASLPGFAVLPELCGPYLSLMGIGVYEQGDPWNLFRGAAGFTASPATGKINEAWRWVPSFFVVEPNDGFGLVPGWYYGKYPTPDYDFDAPLESLKVSLCAVSKTRDPANKQTGWCETVTSVNGENVCDINFYMDPAVPAHETAYREVALVLATKGTLTIGTALSGFPRAFQIAGTRPGEKPEVDFWSFRSWGADGEQDAFGILIVEGKGCRGYKHFGATAMFVSTENYHSHAVSQNGRLVAIFEGQEFIERVRVFDLYGTRTDIKKDEYVRGGYTELRDSAKVGHLEASSGCFVPFPEEDFEPLQPLFTFGGEPVSEIASGYTDYMPSLATLVFIKDGTSSLSIKKVVCDNGVDAEFAVTIDECFGSKILIDDPLLTPDEDKLVSTWNAGGLFRGHVRGNFTGNHPNIRFNGLSSGNLLETVTLKEDLILYRDIFGTVHVEDAVGEISYGGCFNADGTVDEDCCEGLFTATTSCGQYGEMDEGNACACPGEEPLTLNAPSSLTPGECFTVTGGVGPYTVEVSGDIALDEAGYESGSLCITELEGCSFTVLVTDVCGASVSFSPPQIDTSCPEGYGPGEITLNGPDPLANGSYHLSGFPSGAEFQWGLEGTGTLVVSEDTYSATVSGVGGCYAELAVFSHASSSARNFSSPPPTCKVTGAPCWSDNVIYEPPVLTLSGTDTPEVGNTYNASGGVPPYIFSISCGSIDASTGKVLDLSGCCGPGTVSVRDACGSSAEIDVRFPSGKWVLIADDTYVPFFDGDCCTYGTTTTVVEEIREEYRYRDTWVEIDQVGGCGVLCEPACYVSPNTSNPGVYTRTCVQRQEVYRWEC